MTYQFGILNHNEQHLAVNGFAGSDVLANDWATQEKMSPESPRFFYSFVIGKLSAIFGLASTYAAVFWFCFLIIALGVVEFVGQLFEDRLVGIVALALFFVGPWADVTLGGNNLFYNYLIPTVVASACTIVALTSFGHERYTVTATALGVAIIMHASVGLWMTGVVGLLYLARFLTRVDGSRYSVREEWRSVGRQLWTDLPKLPFFIGGVLATIGLGPLIYANITHPWGAKAVHTIAEVRHPHHYLPFTWGLAPFIAYGSLVAAAALVALAARISGVQLVDGERAAVAGTYLGSLFGVMGIGGVMLTEIVPIAPVIKLQPFHIAYFPKIVLFGVIGAGLVRGGQAVVEAASKLSGYRLSSTDAVNVTAVALFLIFLQLMGPIATAGTDGPGAAERNYARDDPVYEFLRNETPTDARVIVPPQTYQARLSADRAIVVDWKTFVFTPDGVAEWQQRINDVCGVNELDSLDGCQFENLSGADIAELATKYDACWLMSPVRDYSFEQPYNGSEYAVYDLRDAAECS